MRSETSSADPFPQSVVGAPVVVVMTRPNDVTAYVIGDVYTDSVVGGPMPIPAIVAPSNGFRLSLLHISAVQKRSPADAALTLTPLLFTAQPTVIADNSPLVLSDADIALLSSKTGSTIATTLSFPQNGGTTALNFNAGANGRRGGVITQSSVTATNALGPALAIPTFFYAWVNAAYVPLAQEVITWTFTPFWSTI